MQHNLSDRLTFGDRALREILKAMPMIHFEPSKRSDLYAVTLHASIVQLCGGCLAMARTDHTAGIPVLLRSMFEAIIDLDNLATDASYHERMDAANLVQFLKLLEVSPTNPLLAGLDQKHDIATITREFQAELADLHSRKRGQKDLRSRCVDVGREDEYTSIYTLLCLDSHNNVTALIDRHVSEGESQALQVDAFGDSNPFSVARRIHFALGWTLQSTQYIHGAFRTGFSVATLLQAHEAQRPMQ